MKKILVFAACIILLIIINGLINSIHTLLQNDQALSQLNKNVTQAQAEHQFLKQRLYYVQTNDYIESEARNKLGMVKNGEHIVIAPLPSAPSTVTIEQSKPNWEKWKELIF